MIISINTLHKWYDGVISHIAESKKKSASDVKEKIMKFFENDVDKNMLKDYKPKLLALLMINISSTKVKATKNYQSKLDYINQN